MDGGIESLRPEELGPECVGFVIEGCGVAHRRTVDRCIETLSRELPAFYQQFPGPGDCLFFEIIAEGPVSQHLEKGVVVGIESDILQVVVLASGADALLGVGGASRGIGAWGCAQEDRHELVHPGVREEKIGGIRQQTRGGDDRMLLAAEEIEE